MLRWVVCSAATEPVPGWNKAGNHSFTVLPVKNEMLTDLLSSVTQILDVTCIVPTRTYSLKTLGYNTSTYLWTLAGITVPQL